VFKKTLNDAEKPENSVIFWQKKQRGDRQTGSCATISLAVRDGNIIEQKGLSI